MPPGAAPAGLTAGLGAAYDASAAAWADGPERLYAALAEALLDRGPRPLAGRRVVDVGTGTGVAARALAARGAMPYGVDLSFEMLRHGRPARAPAAVADALRLPFATASAGGVVYACCLNHLVDPVAALREGGRVVAPGGVVLASVFASANDHPAKAVLDGVLAAYGWRRPGWHTALKDVAEPILASAERFAAAADAAGLAAVDAVEVTVETGLDRAADLVSWRFGMAHAAPFVAALPEAERVALLADARRAVGAAPEPLRPRVVLLAAVVPQRRGAA